jgi:serine/threonine protein kinase
VDIEFPIYLSGEVVDFIGKILNRDPTKRMSLEEVESHGWMRKYENEPGRMIPKEIWDAWTKLSQA